MAMTCRVCQHPQRDEIEKAAISGETPRSIEKRFGGSVSDTSILRHTRDHVQIAERRAELLAQRRAELEAEYYRLRETAYNHADQAAADHQHYAVAPILSVAQAAVAFAQRDLERAEAAVAGGGGGGGGDGDNPTWLEAVAIRVGGRRR